MVCSALLVVLMSRYTGALGKGCIFFLGACMGKSYTCCKATAAVCVQEHCSGRVYFSTAGLMYKLLSCSCCSDCAREGVCCLACMHVHMHGMSCVRFRDHKSRVEAVKLFQYEMA